MTGGGTKAARRTVRATPGGDLRGIAPTGEQATSMGMAIYHLAGCTIGEVLGLNGARGIMQLVGAIPSD